MRSPDDLSQQLAADRARALALTPVSRETLLRLDRLVPVLLEWQATTNLIGPATIPEIWTRHIADSLQLLALAPKSRSWIDLGSGGGFPGLVIACAMAGIEGGRVHLVESNGKKAAFLREASRLVGLPTHVHNVRIEDYVKRPGIVADTITARALAPVDVLLGYIQPLMHSGAVALLQKGQDVETELQEAAIYWNIESKLVTSKTSPSGRILIVRAVAPRAQAS
jgi:16S rRNA (guanine527-N7)-methyltransferase